jgi:hypothetical protein
MRKKQKKGKILFHWNEKNMKLHILTNLSMYLGKDEEGIIKSQRNVNYYYYFRKLWCGIAIRKLFSINQ